MKIKNLPTVIALLCFIAVVSACKKKKEAAPGTGTPATPTYMFSAKVNGTDFNTNYHNSYSSGGMYGFSGTSSMASNYPWVSLYGSIKTGTYAIGSGFSARYEESSSMYYTAQTGSITITQIDTLLHKFTGTFNFKTDTVSGKSFNVTNGSVNYNN